MMRLILLLLSVGVATLSPAQSFHVKFSGGYSFPLAAYSMGTNSMSHEITETDPETGYYVPQGYVIKEERVTGSMNTGPSISATVGVHFSSNASVELDMGYVSGKRYETMSEEKETLNGNVRHLRSEFRTWDAANAFISPSFVLTTGESLLKPYLKAGPLLALVRVTEEGGLRFEGDNPQFTQTKQEYSGSVALGLRGTAGVEMRLNETVSIFSELAFLGMRYAPKEKEMVSYKVDGEEQIGQWTVRQRKVVFVDATSLDTRNVDSSPDTPYKDLKSHFGMSSLTALAGLKIGF